MALTVSNSFLARCLPAALLLSGAAWWALRRRRTSKAQSTLPPMVPHKPWDLVKLFSVPCFPQNLMGLCREMAVPIFRLSLPMRGEVYVVDDWQTALRILNDRGCDKVEMQNVMTNGVPSIFTRPTRSPEWQFHRRLVAPAFRAKVLSDMSPALRGKLDDFYAILEEHAEKGTPVDIDDLLMWLTLDFISLSAFDYDLRALRDPKSEGRKFLACTEFILTSAMRRQFRPYLRWMFWTSEAQKVREASQWMQNLSLRILKAYREAHSAEAISTDDRILAHLIRNEHYADEASRAADVTTFLVAGHDTTAHSLAWTLYELSRNPAIQEKAQAELDAVSDGLADGAVPWSQLAHLNRCLKESMRLWPVAASGPMRRTGSDIEAHGVVIPKGQLVRLPFMSLFRPTWLEDTDKYVPDRWVNPIPDMEAMLVPFSAGPRNCVGQNLANMELRSVLIGTLRRFSFELAKDPQPEFAVTMKPRALQLYVKRRDATL